MLAASVVLCTIFLQQHDYWVLLVMIFKCPMKCRGTFTILFRASIHIGTILQKKLDNISVTRSYRFMEGLPPILIRGIDNLWK